MWESQPLATLRASTACTGITLPLPIFFYNWGIELNCFISGSLSGDYEERNLIGSDNMYLGFFFYVSLSAK
jgi:hypothetical protein